MKPQQNRPELLAPAGSTESFFAAMEAGADAVYCGLHDFSARAKARNFGLGDIEKVLAWARSHDRRLYVTLNTLVKESELPQLVETLAALEATDVDGVIIQDLAVWRLARDHFPGLDLHSSTQMTVHNSAGVLQLERMGIKRAVLARELTIEEIRHIRAHTSIELEHFVHGALCFSFSGQCSFSSFLGGKSGNRGRCAPPCRRRYRYRNKEGYYFSPNDLSAIDLLDELEQAGVGSFKIEGRMKSAEYVHQVVGAYRQVLDAAPQDKRTALRTAKERLKNSFGRQPTRGFLGEARPTDLVTPNRKGSTGRFLGEVTRIRGTDISFKTGDRLHLGDRLRIQPKTDKAGSAFTIKTLRQGKNKVRKVDPGAQVTVPSPYRDIFQPGDAVFKVSSDQAFTLSEAACRRRLGQASRLIRKVDLHIGLTEDELLVRGEVAGLSLERRYPVTTEAAASSPLDAGTLRGVFSRSGDQPLALDRLETGELPAVVIAPSRLKEIRRSFYQDLAAALGTQISTRRREHLEQARQALLARVEGLPDRSPGVTVAVRDLRDTHVLRRPGVNRLVLPLTGANVQGLSRQGRHLSSRPGQVVWDIPFVQFDTDWTEARKMVQYLVSQGFRTFRLNNIGHFPLFDNLENVRLLTGYRLFSLNSQAMLAWKELGVEEVTLYLEDDRENLTQILCRPTGLRTAVTAYAPVPVMISRIALRSVKPDAPVVSDRGEGYRVGKRDGLTVVTPETDFSLLGRLDELEEMGCSQVVVDLAHCGAFSAKGKKVMDATERNHALPGTTLFNFDHGIE